MVEAALRRYFRSDPNEPELIRRAMRYSVLAGGKRLRPVLVIAAAEACGQRAERVLPTACAVEMIHTYSLIHDDLPAMDDDDLRRGRPANHKVFGEAVAILAGDGLLTRAFELISENGEINGVGPECVLKACRAIAGGAGSGGMVGGQVLDIRLSGRPGRGTLRELHCVHRRKTAALIAACLEAGAVLARASMARIGALREYGFSIGLAFQITDDVLDVIGDKKKLGKMGSDSRNKKLTFPGLLGLEVSRGKAEEAVAKAHRVLKPFGFSARALHDLADYILERDR